MKKTIITIIATFIIIFAFITFLYATPRLKVINKFEEDYGKIEVYQDIKDGSIYTGSYVELKVDDILLKLPTAGTEKLDFSITSNDYCIKCKSEQYDIIVIKFDDDFIENTNVECDNEFFFSYELLEEFEMNYLGITRDNLIFFQSVSSLEFYYSRYGLKKSILEKWGSKYCNSYINMNYEVLSMYNDSVLTEDDYDVITMIVYEKVTAMNLIPYAAIKIRKENGSVFTEEEVRSMTFSLEIANNN